MKANKKTEKKVAKDAAEVPEEKEEKLAEKEEMLPTLKGSMNSYNANC
ncbi:MAG: hypothetical protein PHO02_03440 [Candidatus Nanoarchaeia archaeon]|nr:hypothetical protein [Candidatus Nanoarchaeia archaeon]